MQIKEILAESTKSLFERLDKTNDTGFLTEDLVSIHRQRESGEWGPELTGDQFDEYMDALTNG